MERDEHVGKDKLPHRTESATTNDANESTTAFRQNVLKLAVTIFKGTSFSMVTQNKATSQPKTVGPAAYKDVA